MDSHTTPHVIDVNNLTAAPVRSYPSGFPELDQAYGDGALRPGALFTVTGEHASGRTQYLLETAVRAAHELVDGEAVCVAVCADSLARMTARLRVIARGNDAVLDRIYLSHTANPTAVALFVASVADAGVRPALLLVDDYGLISQDAGADLHRVLTSLATGKLGDAVYQTSGATLTAFGLDRNTSIVDPVAVLVTARVRDNRNLPTGLVQHSTVVVEVDGTVHKSRVALSGPRTGGEVRYFVDRDGDNEPCLWKQEGDRDPMPVLRRVDLDRNHRSEWANLVRAFVSSKHTS